MPWAIPEFSTAEVNAAANILKSGTGDLDAAFGIVDNWRASHSFPLNTFQTGLRRRTPESALVAQRLKRLSSVIGKLQREPDMKLSQMQDIGGCRAVLDSVDSVVRVRESYLNSRLKHHFVKDRVAVSMTAIPLRRPRCAGAATLPV